MKASITLRVKQLLNESRTLLLVLNIDSEETVNTRTVKMFIAMIEKIGNLISFIFNHNKMLNLLDSYSKTSLKCLPN